MAQPLRQEKEKWYVWQKLLQLLRLRSVQVSDHRRHRQKELEHQERILREQEVELRLRKMETNIHATNAAFHQTVKHQPENFQKPWMKKVILGGKLFALGVVALVGVKIASVLARFIIAALVWMFEKLFF